jgi:hypothetical protein
MLYFRACGIFDTTPRRFITDAAEKLQPLQGQSSGQAAFDAGRGFGIHFGDRCAKNATFHFYQY